MCLPGYLKQLIQEIVTTTQADRLRRILIEYPELWDSDIELGLTNCLREAWNQGDKLGTCNHLAARSFLKCCRDEGVEVVLTKPLTLPLGRNSPLAKLMDLTYERVDLLQRVALARQVLVEVRKSSEPELWAALQREVADCLSYSEGPNRAELLEEALEAYRATLEVRGQSSYVGTPIWAQTLQAMAATFYRRIKGDRAENLRQACSLYEKTLTVFTKKTHPEKWAKIQHDLGTIWLEMPDGEKIKNIERGIGYYKTALTICTRETMPNLWAETTNDLAIAYSEHPGKDRKENIEKALKLCESVLETRSPELNVLDWARSFIALGNIYLMRLQGGRMENLEQAIRHYEQALEVLSPKLHPSDWAKAGYDVAMAYSDRLAGDRVKNLAQAITYFEQALEVYTPDEHPLEWGYVQTGLGYLHHQLGLMQSADNLERAIVCYEKALTVRTLENDPVGRATVQSHLGNVYADRVLGERSVNQEKAIACYKEALQVRTRQEAPSRWAETLNNMGTVYMERLWGNSTQNQQQAIDCFQKALQVHKPLTFPHYCRRAARNLANLLFSQKHWVDAAHYYAIAIKSTEQLYHAAVVEPGRQAEMAESQTLFANQAYALAHLGQFEKAVECLEAGRARALSEGLNLQQLALAVLSPSEQENLQSIINQIRNLEAELREDSPRPFPAIAADLKNARSQLPDLEEEIRFATISQIAKLGQPLVYLVTTLHGSLAILVPAGVKKLTKREVVWLDHFTSLDLRRFFLESFDERQTGNYLKGMGVDKYDTSGQYRLILENALDHLLPQLGKRLMKPLAERLKEFKINRITLIPGGLLSLFPLQAVSYPALNHSSKCSATDPETLRYFLDDFDVTYAPAARILRNDTLATVRTTEPSLFAVGDPHPLPPGYPSLPFACVEIEGITHFFAKNGPVPLYETEATYAAVKAQLHSKPPPTYLHFACHGEFNPLEPLASGLLLAGQGETSNVVPTLLTLKDLLGNFTLTGVRLVVLSACQTAITEMDRLPDEAIGLPAGFLQTGALAVIGSLWPVNDVSTALLMGRLYLYHLKGDPDNPEVGPFPPAQALRRAQQWLRDEVTAEMAAEVCLQRVQALREQGGWMFKLAQEALMNYDLMDPDSHPFTHPIFWAPFTISGQ